MIRLESERMRHCMRIEASVSSTPSRVELSPAADLKVVRTTPQPTTIRAHASRGDVHLPSTQTARMATTSGPKARMTAMCAGVIERGELASGVRNGGAYTGSRHVCTRLG